MVMPRTQHRRSALSVAVAVVALIGLFGFPGAAGRSSVLPAHAAGDSSARAVSSRPFLGNWRVYSARLYFDAGGGGDFGTPASRLLTLAAGGTWKYGPSTGTWAVQPVKSADWKRWEVSAYGPTRKLVVVGWSKGTADGPIEESNGRVDFMWLIYHVQRPVVSDPGIVDLKFGHTDL
jgi:hypothetical protein